MTNTLLLFDFSNLMRRCAHLPVVRASSANPAWQLCSYLVFNSIYDFLQNLLLADADSDPQARTQARHHVVLALDDARGGYWRSDVFSPYKADREARRRKDGIDWPAAHAFFDGFLEDIRTHLPWAAVSFPRCEADDVIYTLSRLPEFDKVIIHSGDSDFLQLVSDRVLVYSPNKGDYQYFPGVHTVAGGEVSCADAAEYLRYCLLTGQGGKDNVYNVKTPSDWAGARKPPFGPKAAEKALRHPGGFDAWLAAQDTGVRAAYDRNRLLIELAWIPPELALGIEAAYRAASENPPADVEGFLDRMAWNSISSPLAREAVASVLLMAAGLSGQTQAEAQTQTEPDPAPVAGVAFEL